MSAATIDRTLARIRKKSELIYEDTDTLSDQIPSHGGSESELQSAIRSHLALGLMWRSLAADVSAGVMSISTTALRDMAEPLRQHARTTLNTCSDLLSLADDRPSLPDVADLKLMRHEMENLLEWFETMPDWNPTNRDRARAAIAAGEPNLTDEEMIAMFTDA